MKQKFLMENVINCGYDPTEFAQFMEYKMGKFFFLRGFCHQLIYLLLSCAEGGTNVDNWEFEALMVAVGEFQQHYQIGGSQRQVTEEDPEVADNQAEAAVGEGSSDPQSDGKKEKQESESEF